MPPPPPFLPTLALTHAALFALCRRLVATHGAYFGSDAFLRLAFQQGEALVNLYTAALFIGFPSFAAHQLTPHFSRDAPDSPYNHPALGICVRLFGSTEILVGSLFAFCLTKQNAPTFLKCVLAGDLAHYCNYCMYHHQYPSTLTEPSVWAHFATMTLVLYTKMLYLSSADQL
jgi:hypothetical protein